MPLTRRALLGTTAGLLAPRRLLAAPLSASDRRFLFVFCSGGWDTTFVFAPEVDNPNVDTEADAVAAEVGGIRFTDHPTRPSVRSFFERYAARTCVLNGFEVRSVTHDRCRQLLMTGRGDTWADDWPSVLAARSSGGLLLPHLVMSGPAFTAEHSSQVVRVGAAGQLPALLDGSAEGATTPTDGAQALEDAFVRARADAVEASAAGRTARLARLYGRSLDQLDELAGYGDLTLTGASELMLCGQNTAGEIQVILDCFERDLSRCGMVKYEGWCANTWDSHSNNDMQGWHFEELFQILDELMIGLETRSGPAGGSLLDEVTVVVCSEMGRAPQLNAGMGKNHWTYTSAMLVGAGVRGGQVIGEMDANFLGRPVDLASGAASDAGTSLQAAHLGATLLAMGDVDPGEYLEGVAPIDAAME